MSDKENKEKIKLTDNVKEEDYTESCMAIGMTMGMAVGIILQTLTANIAWFVLGIAFGMIIGYTIGLTKEDDKKAVKISKLQEIIKVQECENSNK